jgi:hypothetical protein
MTLEFWILFVEWWQPHDSIDVVPDLSARREHVKSDEST